jgi:hypothetical protein
MYKLIVTRVTNLSWLNVLMTTFIYCAGHGLKKPFWQLHYQVPKMSDFSHHSSFLSSKKNSGGG